MAEIQKIYCDYCGSDIASSNKVSEELPDYSCLQLRSIRACRNAMGGVYKQETERYDFCDLDCCSLWFEMKKATQATME